MSIWIGSVDLGLYVFWETFCLESNKKIELRVRGHVFSISMDTWYCSFWLHNGFEWIPKSVRYLLFDYFYMVQKNFSKEELITMWMTGVDASK